MSLMNNSIAVHAKKLACYKVISATRQSRDRIVVETPTGQRTRVSANQLMNLKDGIQHIKSSF